MKFWSWGAWRGWKRWRNLLILCLGGWVAYVELLNGLIIYFAMDTSKTHPEVKLIPTPLVNSEIASMSTGTTISSIGYTIRVPWSGPFERRDLKTFFSIRTNDGSSMMFFGPTSQANPREIYKGDAPEDTSPMEDLLGHQELSSGYQLFRSEMYSSPNQVGIWHLRKTNARTFVLLNLKEMFLFEETTEIHPISGEHVHGFEALSTRKGHQVVHLELFDDRDRELSLILSSPLANSSGLLTQEKINAIVASIQIPESTCTVPGKCS